MTFEIDFAGKGNQFPNNFQIFSIKIPRQLVTGTIVKPIIVQMATVKYLKLKRK